MALTIMRQHREKNKTCSVRMEFDQETEEMTVIYTGDLKINRAAMYEFCRATIDFEERPIGTISKVMTMPSQNQ